MAVFLQHGQEQELKIQRQGILHWSLSISED